MSGLWKNTTLILCHGWGFTPHFWDNFLLDLPQPKDLILWDLGYGTAPENRPLPSHIKGPLIGIGHSLGFTQLALSTIPFTLLVGINGFMHLGLENPTLTRKIQQMERLLLKNSFQMLTQFYGHCGSARGGLCEPKPNHEPSYFPSSPPINLTRLQEDLHLLKTIDCAAPLRQRQTPLYLFLNEHDPIVPYGPTKNQFDCLDGQAKVWTSKASHHGVPPQQWTLLKQQLTCHIQKTSL